MFQRWFQGWKTKRALHRTVSSVSVVTLLAEENEHEVVRLGDLCQRERRTELAVTAYARAAQLYQAKQHPQKVIAMRRRVVELTPYDPDAHIDLARALELVGRHKEARFSLQAAADLLQASAPSRAAKITRMAMELG